jgi:hypothetical protein
MPSETEYNSEYFLNLYNENANVTVDDEKEEEKEEEEKEQKFDSSYFLNQYNSSIDSEQEEKEFILQEEERISEERIELENQILDEDVELEKYEGKKELIREAEPTTYNSNYFLNQYNSTTSKDLPSAEPTIAQKIQLGGKLERHTLGNLFRTIKAGAATISNNKSFQENIKEIETERTDKIFKYMEEEYGIDFRKNENDAAVITGRIGAALGDVVTFFIPWAKIAKLGKIGATATGAGIGAADMSLYEYAAYGEVNPNNVLFGAAVGGGSSLLGAAVANRFKSVDGDDINLGKINGPDADVVVKSSVKPEKVVTLTANETEDLNRVLPIVLKENSNLLKELEGSLVLSKLYVKAKNAQQALKDATKANSKFDKASNKLKVKIEGKAPFSAIQIKNLTKKSDEAKEFMNNEFVDLMEKYAKGQAYIATDGTLKIMKKEGVQITDGILQTVLNETFRPLFGAGVGFTAGTFIGDEDDAINYSLIGAGMTFGLVYNRVKNAPYLLIGEKEKAFGIINNNAARMLHNFLKVKGSGTTASRNINHGGENEVLSRMLLPQMDGKYKNIISAEEATDAFMGIWARRIDDVVQRATDVEGIAATKIIRQLTTPAELKASGKFTPESLIVINNLVKNGKLFVKEMNAYAGQVIKYDKIKNYDLPQIWSQGKILGNIKESKKIVREALKAENPTMKPAQIRKSADEIIDNITGNGSEKIFKGSNFGSGKLGTFTGVPQLKNFEKARTFQSLEARKILEPILEENLKDLLGTFTKNTVKGVEFARKFGQNGEVLSSLNKTLGLKLKNGLINQKEYNMKIKLMGNTVNAYFGMLHKSGDDILQGNMAKDGFALLTFLSNTTMLPRSIIPQLGDFLQPFQNSSVRSATTAAVNAWKKDNLASLYGVGGTRSTSISSTVVKDLEGVFSAGMNPTTNLQARLGNLTQTFFKYNLMAPATNLAARVAFSSGIDEVFTLAKKIGNKKTISKALSTRLKYYGLNMKDLKGLSKFKSVKEALESPVGESLLIKAGNKAFKRDVGLPGIGNRMLFAQSNNPLAKSVGLFLSWAQYKVGQMNGLINRVEDGDVKLAIKMLGTITIFGGLRELQMEMSPAREFYEKNEPENFGAKWWGQASALAGIVDWRVEKLSTIVSSWSGNGYSNATSNITPLFSELDKLYNGAGKTYKNFSTGDYEGAAVTTLKTLPLGSEFVDYTNRASEFLTEEALLEDRANIKTSSGTQPLISRADFSIGGIVGEELIQGPEVPFTQDNPADRINPITGLPYNQPAITYK